MQEQSQTGELHQQEAAVEIHRQSGQAIGFAENQSATGVGRIEIKHLAARFDGLMNRRLPERCVQRPFELPRVQPRHDATGRVIQTPRDETAF